VRKVFLAVVKKCLHHLEQFLCHFLNQCRARCKLVRMPTISFFGEAFFGVLRISAKYSIKAVDATTKLLAVEAWPTFGLTAGVSESELVQTGERGVP
jgi:hypothetical protein